jgi:cyclopropane-fatty-acyl-phospholipid synthase
MSVRNRLLAVVVDRMVRIGSLELYAAGELRVRRGVPPLPEASITIHDPNEVANRVMRGGSVGFAEAYIDGLWDTPDLAALLELAVRNHDAHRGNRAWPGLIKGSRALWARLMPKPGPSAVHTMVDHYDLGNEFYARWLDASMSYSSAIFDGTDDLTTAQRVKYERISTLAGIRPGESVLEIGCGWGAMTEHAAGRLGCTVTAVTISSEQHAFVTRRMKEAGLEDRVEVILADFREIGGTFDRVVSIEMIESIDEASWPPLFEVISRSLLPGGVAALQAITIDSDLHEDMIGRDEFIRSYIFPGGALPSMGLMRRLGEEAGLDWIGMTTHGPSYARTLAEWDRRFVSAWPDIVGVSARFDDRFFRMWRYYLAYCEAGFRTGRLDGVQAAYRKPF